MWSGVEWSGVEWSGVEWRTMSEINYKNIQPFRLRAVRHVVG